MSTRPGGSIETRFASLSDGRVAIAIAGAAIGMSAADLCVALEPFGRAGEIGWRCSQQGTGLGLRLAALVGRTAAS